MIILPDFRIHQRDYLLKISRAITAQLDLEVVLRMILEASVSMLSGEIGLIALRGPNSTLSVQAVLGTSSDRAEVFNPLLQLINGEEAEADPDELQLHLRLISRKLDMTLRQVVSLPMRISGKVLGVIYVLRPYPGKATPDDVRVLESFADQAAIAVHNAGLYQATIAEKQRLSTLLDASADGIMILDATRHIIRVNSALAHLIGWQQYQTLNRLHEDVVRWADPQPPITLASAMREGWPFEGRFVDEAFEDGTMIPFYVEGELERLDGMTVSVEIKYAPVFFDDGNLRNIIANVRDITRFREAEKMKDTFISVVSHELKTPVALIKGYAGTLRREDASWDTETLHRGLGVIEEEADRLTELIENLLMASRLQVEGIMRYHPVEIALDQMAANAVERFRHQAPAHEFVLDFDEDFPVIEGDEKGLRHVLDNLISNAIKYSPEGGQITVGGRSLENQVQVFVSDEGIGLAPADVSRVFDRFYRAPGAVSQGTPGTGLGLYLVRAIIEAHSGQIWASSDPDQRPGTTFSFTLPHK